MNKIKSKTLNFKSNIKQDSTISRLNRIRGQIDGIIKMYERDPCDCVSLVQQIQAVRSALAQVGSRVLTNEANRCVDEGEGKRLKEVIEKTFKTFN